MFLPVALQGNSLELLQGERLLSSFEAVSLSFTPPKINILSYEPSHSNQCYSDLFLLNVVRFTNPPIVSDLSQKKEFFIKNIWPIFSTPSLLINFKSLLLTNYRFVLIPENEGRYQPPLAWTLALSDIEAIEDMSTLFRTKPLEMSVNSKLKYIFNLLEQCACYFFQIEIKTASKMKSKLLSEIKKAIEEKRPKEIYKMMEEQAFSSVSAIQSIQSEPDNKLPSGFSPYSPPPPPLPAKPEATLYSAGISGVLKRQEEKQKYVEDLTKESLKDFKSLMEKAQEVIQVIERYSHDLGQSTKQNGLAEEEKDLFESIIKMGLIKNPISKSNSGKNYYKDLALEIGTLVNETNFLAYYSTKKKNLLKKNTVEIKQKNINSQDSFISLPFPPRFTKMLLITDLYCIVNRKRGQGNLISPNDLLEGCRALETIPELNLSLFTLKNGTKLIKQINNKKNSLHFPDLNDSTSKSILSFTYFSSYLSSNESLTPQLLEDEISDDLILFAIHLSHFYSFSFMNCYNTFEIANYFDLPLDIINNLTNLCESYGLICRDSYSYDGVKFYLNLFQFV